MPKTSKARFCDRLKSEGRWGELNEKKREMLANGVPADQVWELLMADPAFMPETKMNQELKRRGRQTIYQDDRPVTGSNRSRLPQSRYEWDQQDERKHVSMTEQVRWVFENIDNQWADFYEAPSAGAFSLLSWVQESAGNKSEFYRNFALRLMPTKSEVDQQMSFRDDGREIFSKLEAYEDAAATNLRVAQIGNQSS